MVTGITLMKIGRKRTISCIIQKRRYPIQIVTLLEFRMMEQPTFMEILF